MQETVITTAETLELYDLAEFEEAVETLENVLPTMVHFQDPDLRRDLPDRLENPLEAEELTTRLSVLTDLLEKAAGVEDLIVAVDDMHQAVSRQYEENMQVVFGQTKAFEQTARSLHLLYENAGGAANVFVMPVDPNKFADAANPKHFDLMCDYLRRKFYKFQMENSPFYLTYCGSIGGRNAMLKMAEIAEETRAIAVVDFNEKKSVREVLDYADTQLKITGSQAKLAHLLIPGTWLYAFGAEQMSFQTDENGHLCRLASKMSVPAAGAIIGKLLGAAPGVFITGLEADPIIGIDGVRVNYHLERIDSKEFAQRGLVQIIDNGCIQGGATPNKSDKPELGKFAKVDAANALLKDIIQYCNNKAFSKWGKKYEKNFKEQIENYLNRRIKCELIEGYSIDHLFYDYDEEVVDIGIIINFFEVADEFAIGLQGAQGNIDLKK